MIEFELVRGMRDYIGEEAEKIRYIESVFRNLVLKYGYMEIISPIVEEFRLFALKGGEELKQTMYVFKDKANRELALRPEITPSVARAYIQYLQSLPKPVRLFYFGTVYRYDEPQYGRYREFRQAGVELIGDSSIFSDIEILDLLYNFYHRLNLSNSIIIKINNIGIFRKIMNDYNIDEDTQEHILHLIDKNKIDEAINIISKKIDSNDVTESIRKLLDKKNLTTNDLKELIEEKDFIKLNIRDELLYLLKIANILSRLNINFKIDLGFVRGLAYYTRLIFEVLHPSVPFSIAGGGRYDKLIEIYGGLPAPAIGFAIGVERTLLVTKIMKNNEVTNIVIIVMSDELIPQAINIANILRREGYTVIINTKSQPLSKLLPHYASQNFKIAIIVGKQEFERNQVTIKNLQTKSQTTIPADNVVDALKQML
ncbi:MAG: histidine--tRNA ligase [Saccharolobus sp.]